MILKNPLGPPLKRGETESTSPLKRGEIILFFTSFSRRGQERLNLRPPETQSFFPLSPWETEGDRIESPKGVRPLHVWDRRFRRPRFHTPLM